MDLYEDVIPHSSQKLIYNDAPLAMNEEVTSRAVADRTVEMASNKVPRYFQQVLAWLAACAAAQPFVSVPSSVPSTASAIVDPDFAGFAFEQASLWNYALDADGNANQFSINLIAGITNRTGGKPLIRLGGTS